MRSFKEYMKENITIFQGPNDFRTSITQMHNLLTNIEPKEAAESQDLLIKLRNLIEDILSGKKY